MGTQAGMYDDNEYFDFYLSKCEGGCGFFL